VLIEENTLRKGFRDKTIFFFFVNHDLMKAVVKVILQRCYWGKETPCDFSLIRKHLTNICR